MTLPSWLAYSGAIAQILTGFGTLTILYFTLVTTIRSKRTDVLMECHRRYSEVMAAESQIPETDWYQRFWSRQFDQFNYWDDGFVDDRTFKFWMDSRRYEYAHEPELYKIVWEQEKRKYGTKFPDFVEAVFRDGAVPAMKAHKHELSGKIFRFLGRAKS